MTKVNYMDDSEIKFDAVVTTIPPFKERVPVVATSVKELLKVVVPAFKVKFCNEIILTGGDNSYYKYIKYKRKYLMLKDN